VHSASHRGGVRVAHRRHGYDLAVDEFDLFVGSEDAGLGHPDVFVDGETPG
jgi:hypothetical protein